jgi:hypothetical protein
MVDGVTMARCLAASDLRVLVFGLWVMLAAILAIGGTYLARAVRRWARREESVEAFTLQDLRDMRARAEISEQEYAALRVALLGRAGVAPASGRGKADSSPPVPGTDSTEAD